MQKPQKQWIDFLKSEGADQISHSEKTYLGHAVAVFNDMQSWQCDDDLCRAALFHSIYGTQLFQRYAFPLERRHELREMIGERAELFAYWNCAMDREAFDQEVFRTEVPFQLIDRFADREIELSADDFDDLCRLHLCDWLEQVERADEWDYRREGYRQMAERLGGIALELYNRVFDLEPIEPARG